MNAFANPLLPDADHVRDLSAYPLEISRKYGYGRLYDHVIAAYDYFGRSTVLDHGERPERSASYGKQTHYGYEQFVYHILSDIYQLSVLNGEAGTPAVLNKVASAQFLKQYLTAVGSFTSGHVTTMQSLFTVIAVAG